MKKLIAFDLETTGLYPEKGDMIIEIAAVPIIDDEIITNNAFESLVNPDKKIPPHITSINHITDEMVKDAKTIEEVLPEFLDYIQDYPLVAHNAPFDVGFLRYFIKTLGLIDIKNQIIDTLALSKELFTQKTYHNLDAVLKRLGIPQKCKERHRALEDAYLTASALIKMRKML